MNRGGRKNIFDKFNEYFDVISPLERLAKIILLLLFIAIAV